MSNVKYDVIRVGRWFPNFVGGNVGACSIMKWIFVYKKIWDNMNPHSRYALYQHELTHRIQQKWRTFPLFFIRYVTNYRRWRARYEIEAFAVQIYYKLIVGGRPYLPEHEAEWMSEFLASWTYLKPAPQRWIYEQILIEYQKVLELKGVKK